MPSNFGRNLPMDPRMIREIQSNSRMYAEQGSGFMQEWGGPERYQQVAGLPETDRVVFYAIQEGYTDPSELEIVTGANSKEIALSLSRLERKGLIVMEPV